MRTRGALATVPFVLLLWLGIAAYLVQKHDAALEGAVQDTRNLTQAFEENIRRTTEAIDTVLRAARVARAHDPAHFDLAAWDRDSGLSHELTLQVSLADRNGDMIATNLGRTSNKAVSIADRAHFRLTRDMDGDGLLISPPVLGRVSARWSVQFVRKLFDSAGAFDGVIVASLDPAFLTRFYASLDIGRGALLLLGNDGIVRASAPQTVSAPGADLSATTLMRAASAEAHGTLTALGPLDGLDRTLSWRRVEPYGVVVVVGLSTIDVLADFRHDFGGGVTIGLALTTLAMLGSAMLARNRRDVTRSQEMLRAAVENISQGLMVIDAHRRVPVLNARAAELLALPPHLSVPGVEFDSLLEWQLEAQEFAGQDAAGVRNLVESGGIDRGSNVYRRKRRNGTVLEVRTKVLDTGLAVRTFTDITEQERIAHDLAEARDAAEAAARARSDFLAVMSHEIRTPLNGVIGVAGLLEGMQLGPQQREYVHLIRQSGDHLLDLINDILDFSRLDAQRVELEAADFDPRALMQGVVALFLAQAGTRALQLSASAAETLPATLNGDPGRLRQILLNLVGNAVKFTDRGWVGVTMTHEMRDDRRLRLLVSVADSGIGIAAEAVGHMFDEFTQMDGSISRRFGGSGLGLAICRRLVELMDGSIAVESQPGVGSTFHFDVTLGIAAASTPPPAAAEADPGPAAPLHILLAEDNPTNRLVALRLLERLGHQADAAANGLEAIAALARTHYDLVLMDVMMPEMDGLTATRHIRTTEPPGARITIVGLTAGSGADSLATCLAAGMDAVTTKPVTLARLRAAIAEGIGSATQRLTAPDRESPTSRLHQLAEMLGPDAVAEIVRTFAEDTKMHLAAMRQAAGQGDSNLIYRAAHSVAGAARNVGADALATRASALENGLASLGPAQIAAEVEAMQRDLDAALQALGIEDARAAEVAGADSV